MQWDGHFRYRNFLFDFSLLRIKMWLKTLCRTADIERGKGKYSHSKPLLNVCLEPPHNKGLLLINYQEYNHKSNQTFNASSQYLTVLTSLWSVFHEVLVYWFLDS